MTRKELFHTTLNDFLSGEGFDLKKNTFLKKESQNTFAVNFSIWPDFGQLEPRYDVFLHQVEQVKKKAWKGIYKKYPSAGNVRFVVSGRNLDECTLDTSTIELALSSAKGEIEFYKKNVRQYFKLNSDITYLDNVLNSQPGEKLDIAYNPVQSSFLALTVAYLAGRKNLSDLIPTYKAIVERINKNYLAEFELLANYILNNPPLPTTG